MQIDDELKDSEEGEIDLADDILDDELLVDDEFLGEDLTGDDSDEEEDDMLDSGYRDDM